MRHHPLPTDLLTALLQSHSYFGRSTKAHIRKAWLDGDYSAFPAYINRSALQRFETSMHGGLRALGRLVWPHLLTTAASSHRGRQSHSERGMALRA